MQNSKSKFQNYWTWTYTLFNLIHSQWITLKYVFFTNPFPFACTSANTFLCCCGLSIIAVNLYRLRLSTVYSYLGHGICSAIACKWLLSKQQRFYALLRYIEAIVEPNGYSANLNLREMILHWTSEIKKLISTSPRMILDYLTSQRFTETSITVSW